MPFFDSGQRIAERNRSIALSEERIGYYKAADIANKAYNEDISLKEAALALNYLSEKEFDKYVNPNRMTSNESWDSSFSR